jgi:hypothetical protein
LQQSVVWARSRLAAVQQHQLEAGSRSSRSQDAVFSLTSESWPGDRTFRRWKSSVHIGFPSVRLMAIEAMRGHAPVPGLGIHLADHSACCLLEEERKHGMDERCQEAARNSLPEKRMAKIMCCM